jgi:hypothetical protein
VLVLLDGPVGRRRQEVDEELSPAKYRMQRQPRQEALEAGRKRRRGGSDAKVEAVSAVEEGVNDWPRVQSAAPARGELTPRCASR